MTVAATQAWAKADFTNSSPESGILVCAADVRGIGDSRPEVGRGNPGYTIEHEAEEEFAWGSLILGKSLLRQRAEDILAVSAGSEERPARRRAAASSWPPKVG